MEQRGTENRKEVVITDIDSLVPPNYMLRK